MEYNIDDPTNIAGISSFIEPDSVRDGINPASVESSITRGDNGGKPKQVDYEKIYDSKVKDLCKEYGIEMKEGNTAKKSKKKAKEESEDDDSDIDIDDILKIDKPSKKKDKPKKGKHKHKSESEDEDESSESSDESSGGSLTDVSNIISSRKKKKVGEYFSSDSEDDSDEIDFVTSEQKKQGYVDDIVGKGNTRDELLYDIQKQNNKARKSQLIVDIKLLRKGLKSNKDIDMKDYQKPTEDMPISYLEALKRELVMLDTRITSSEMVEEIIVLGLKGIGKFLDGKRSILGIKPRVTGYHNQAQIKLRRMKYQTSKFLGSIIGEGEMHPAIQLGTSLGVGMLLYSGFNLANDGKKDNEKKEDEYDEEKYKEDMLNISNM
jgi:hypothetical protein